MKRPNWPGRPPALGLTPALSLVGTLMLGCAAPPVPASAPTRLAELALPPLSGATTTPSLLRSAEAQWVPRSASVLMPEWGPDVLGELRPLGPGAVVWGDNPLQVTDAQLAGRTREYRALGVQHVATNTWLLTPTEEFVRTHPAYRDVSCLDLDGRRIVPPWLAGGADAEPEEYWACTNHPLFRELMRDTVRRGVAAGADMVLLDDHLGTSSAAAIAGGCFCEHCMAGFRAWLGEHYSERELRDHGIENLATFYYGEHVRSAGVGSHAAYVAQPSRVPLYAHFRRFQQDAAVAFVAELKALATQAAGAPVALGVNAYNLEPAQLADAHVADYFATEVEHRGREDVVPPFAYKLADALERPLFSTASGGDWAAVSKASEVTRVRAWIATAYAFGHHFMYAYKKWAHDEQQGSSWYQTPVSTYEPLTTFAREHRALLDGYAPLAQLALLYDNRAAHHQLAAIQRVVHALHEANVSFELVAAGDEQLRHELTTESVRSDWSLLTLPSPALEGRQAEVLAELAAQGRVLTWRDLPTLRAQLRPWLAIEGSNQVWVLPRASRQDPQAPLVLHLLNRAYDEANDEMTARGPFTVQVSRELLGVHAGDVQLHSPGAGPRRLVTRRSEQGLTIEVPSLAMWGLLEVR